MDTNYVALRVPPSIKVEFFCNFLHDKSEKWRSEIVKDSQYPFFSSQQINYYENVLHSAGELSGV